MGLISKAVELPVQPLARCRRGERRESGVASDLTPAAVSRTRPVANGGAPVRFTAGGRPTFPEPLPDRPPRSELPLTACSVAPIAQRACLRSPRSTERATAW